MKALQPLLRYFDFSGRSDRAEYWQWVAVSTIGGWVVQALDAAANSNPYSASHNLIGVYTISTLIPTVAVAFRRLHDIGRSGWWFLTLLIWLIVDILWMWAGISSANETGDFGIERWAAASCIALVLYGAYLIVLLARAGNPGANRFGDPSTAAAEARGLSVAVKPPRARQDHTDIIAELERLGNLRDRGLLTEDELALQKLAVLQRAGTDEPTPRATHTPMSHPPVNDAAVLSADLPHETVARPRDAIPSDGRLSSVWKERFEFFDRHGLRSSPQQRQAFSNQSFSQRSRLIFSGWAFLFGPFYFLFLGLWRPAVVLVGTAVVISLLADPVAEAISPGAASDMSSLYYCGFLAAISALNATTVIPLYYLKKRRGIDTWNPFARSA